MKSKKLWLLCVSFLLFVSCSTGKFEKMILTIPLEETTLVMGLAQSTEGGQFQEAVEKTSYAPKDIENVRKAIEKISYNKEVILEESAFLQEELEVCYLHVGSATQEEGVTYITDGKNIGVVIELEGENIIYQGKGPSPYNVILNME